MEQIDMDILSQDGGDVRQLHSPSLDVLVVHYCSRKDQKRKSNKAEAATKHK